MNNVVEFTQADYTDTIDTFKLVSSSRTISNFGTDVAALEVSFRINIESTDTAHADAGFLADLLEDAVNDAISAYAADGQEVD